VREAPLAAKRGREQAGGLGLAQCALERPRAAAFDCAQHLDVELGAEDARDPQDPPRRSGERREAALEQGLDPARELRLDLRGRLGVERTSFALRASRDLEREERLPPCGRRATGRATRSPPRR
jgi:hypothetical protein